MDGCEWGIVVGRGDYRVECALLLRLRRGPEWNGWVGSGITDLGAGGVG